MELKGNGKMNEKLKRTQLLEDLDKVRQRIAELEESEAENIRVEEELRRNMDRFRHVADDIPLGVLTTDVQGQIRYANSLFIKMFDLDSFEAAYQINVMKFSPFVEARVAEEFQKCLETRNQSHWEYTFRNNLGETFWLRQYFVPILDKDGSVSGIFSIISDRTEEKRLEVDLKQKLTAEKNIHLLLSKLVGTLEIDETINALLGQLGEIVEARRVFLFLLYENDTKVDNTHEWCSSEVDPLIDGLQNLPSADFSWWMKKLRQGEMIHVPDISSLPEEAKMEKEFMANQESQSVLLLPVKIKDRFSGFVGCSFALETRKWKEEELVLFKTLVDTIGSLLEKKRVDDVQKERDERFRRLAHASVEGILIMDNGKIIDSNYTVGTILGYKPSEYLGKEIAFFIEEKDQERVSQNIKSGSSTPFVCSIRKKDSQTLPVEIQMKTLLYQDKSLAIAAIRDISQREKEAKKDDTALEKLKEALEGSIQALATSVAMHDPYTTGHERGVANLACAIAKNLGFPDNRIEGIKIAAIVHDIGKITIPTEILSKPGKVTEIEFLLIKSHPQTAYDLLKDIDFPWPVAQTVHQHHERMDGSGYPEGISGEDIIVESRILGVADVIEAILSRRSYREAKGVESAISELSAGKGTLYDPKVVDAALKIISKKGFSLASLEQG